MTFPILVSLGVVFHLLSQPVTSNRAPEPDMKVHRGASVDKHEAISLKIPFSKGHVYRENIPISKDLVLEFSNLAKQVTGHSSLHERERVREAFKSTRYSFKLNTVNSLKKLYTAFYEAVEIKKNRNDIVIVVAVFQEKIKPSRNQMEVTVDLDLADVVISPKKVNLGLELGSSYHKCAYYKEHQLPSIKRSDPSFTCYPSEHGYFSLIIIKKDDYVAKYDYVGRDTIRVNKYEHALRNDEWLDY